MRRILLWLLLLVLSVILGIHLSKGGNSVFMAYQQWSVEMPLWFFIMFFILLGLIFTLFINFINYLICSKRRLTEWLLQRQQLKSRMLTYRGLLFMLNGQWRQAKDYLINGATTSEIPLINYLNAAKALHQLEAYEHRDECLKKASLITPDGKLLAGLLQAEYLIAQQKFGQALSILQCLRVVHPKHSLLIHLLKDALWGEQDWLGLMELLSALKRYTDISQDQFRKLSVTVYSNYISLLQSSGSTGWKVGWRNIPRTYRNDPRIVNIYVNKLMQVGEQHRAATLVVKCLKSQWDEELVHTYGLIRTSKLVQQLRHAESWLSPHGDSPQLNLTLGRLCLAAALWGKAEDYLKASLAIKFLPETCILLATLMEKIHQPERALYYYRLVGAKLCQLVVIPAEAGIYF